MYHLILNVLVFFLPLLHGDKSTASNPDIKEGNEAYTVSFYPEGGRLILNTACVVAFKAESRDGRTLDISGEIVDDRGNIVQNVKSLYNGLGYFNIYPDEGRTYYLNCKSTEGIEKSFILPAATLSIGIKVHFKEDQILVSALKPEHLQFKDTLYILLQSEDSIVYKDIWDFSRRWIVFEKKNIKTGLSSFLLVDSNGDLLSGRPFFKLENISSLQSLPPDFKIRLLPIMNDPGTDSIRKNLVLDTLAKTLTIDQEQSEPDKRPDDDIWKTIELENVEIKAFKGLSVNFARENHAQVIVRGLRAVTDFEYELQMAQTNRILSTDVDTMFLTTSLQYAYLSSTTVKEAASFGADISKFVPEYVVRQVEAKLSGMNHRK